jgi:hypothetical protein
MKKVIKGQYLKISALGRFKIRVKNDKTQAVGKTIRRGIYPFSSTVLSDMAF